MWSESRSTPEAGNYDWNNVSPDGARGKWQFMPDTWVEAATWAGVSPDDHSPAAQDAAALALWEHEGYNPWRGDGCA